MKIRGFCFFRGRHNMKIDIEKFEKLVIKATLNHQLSYYQLIFSGGKIRISIVNSYRDIVIKHTLINDVITGMQPRRQYILNFFKKITLPSKKKKKKAQIYLSTGEKISSDLVPGIEDPNLYDLEITDELFIIKSATETYKTKIFSLNQIKQNLVQQKIPACLYFVTLNPDQLEILLQQKKLGRYFRKMYFEVDKNKLYISITDKAHSIDGCRQYITDVNYNNCLMCFEYKNIEALLNIIDDKYKIRLNYNPERVGGMLYCHSIDNREKYFLMNREL